MTNCLCVFDNWSLKFSGYNIKFCGEFLKFKTPPRAAACDKTLRLATESLEIPVGDGPKNLPSKSTCGGLFSGNICV